MILTGVVRGRTIEITSEAVLPEGAIVTLEARIEAASAPSPDAPVPPAEATPLQRELAAWAGSVDDLPTDAAHQHDHYLYGRPKR